MSALTVRELAYAKINLYLDVVGRRQDGYHELVTVMQTVSLADTLEVTRVAGEGISLDTGGVLPADESNLAVRAARAYFAARGSAFGTHTVLEKRIPMQAGLGGGSADAAAMLRALNRLDGSPFTVAELCRIGATVGADVPFLVVGGTALCRGIGEVITPAESRFSAPLVVAMAGEGVSTPAAFATLDAQYGNFEGFTPDRSEAPLLAALKSGSITDTVSGLFNRFEEVVLNTHSKAAALKSALLAGGAHAALMSGSGPAVFGIFPDTATAEKAAKALTAAGARAFLCQAV